jgi:hypothetical protein
MTPREKAKDIVERFIPLCGMEMTEIQCALIAVDEMLSNDGWSSSLEEWNTFKNYFEEVKQEIKKL